MNSSKSSQTYRGLIVILVEPAGKRKEIKKTREHLPVTMFVRIDVDEVSPRESTKGKGVNPIQRFPFERARWEEKEGTPGLSLAQLYVVGSRLKGGEGPRKDFE